MKIGVISDTHGCVATWREVYARYFHNADLIIHAGDILYHGPRNLIPEEYNPAELAQELNHCSIPMVVAAGNCDAEVDSMVLNMPVQAPFAYALVDGLRIIVNHGHKLEDSEKWKVANRMKVQLMITGHTHLCGMEKKDGMVWLNPGSPSMSKREDKKGTIAIIDGRRVKILEVKTGEVLAEEEL